jgi:hypothetical protein
MQSPGASIGRPRCRGWRSEASETSIGYPRRRTRYSVDVTVIAIDRRCLPWRLGTSERSDGNSERSDGNSERFDGSCERFDGNCKQFARSCERFTGSFSRPAGALRDSLGCSSESPPHCVRSPADWGGYTAGRRGGARHSARSALSSEATHRDVNSADGEFDMSYDRSELVNHADSAFSPHLDASSQRWELRFGARSASHVFASIGRVAEAKDGEEDEVLEFTEVAASHSL